MCHSQYDPDHPLETRLSNYLSGRLESRKDEINWFLLYEKLDWGEVTSHARRFAEVLLSGVAALGWFDDQDELGRLIREQSEGDSKPTSITRICEVEAVDQLLAEKAIAALKSAETRFWKLLRHASLTRRTSPRGQAFLKRISLCYMFEFDAECIVMCRAVLDAEFQAHISTDDCIQELGLASNRRRNRNGCPLYVLAEQIDVAEKTGRIDPATRKRAQNVVRHGNQVVHRDPSTLWDPFDIISDTLAVIDVLSL